MKTQAGEANNMADDLVEIERVRIVAMGGSLYARIGPALKKRFNDPGPGDDVIYKQAPESVNRAVNSDDVFIAIEKQGEK